MSRKHLRREPQHVAEDPGWWFYEEHAGITVVAPPLPTPGDTNKNVVSARTRIVTIPWTRIRAALKRKDQS